MSESLSPNALELTKIITTLMEATGNNHYSQRNIWLTIRYIRDMPSTHKYYMAVSVTELHDAINALVVD